MFCPMSTQPAVQISSAAAAATSVLSVAAPMGSGTVLIVGHFCFGSIQTLRKHLWTKILVCTGAVWVNIFYHFKNKILKLMGTSNYIFAVGPRYRCNNEFLYLGIHSPCFISDLLISPTAIRKTLLMTVMKARRKRQAKGILGCVDSSQEISDTSDTGASAACPVSLQNTHTYTHTHTQWGHMLHVRQLISNNTYIVYYLIPTSWPVRMIHSKEVWMKPSNSWFWA